MRKLSLVFFAAALSGCEMPSEDLGGFTLYPTVADTPGYWQGAWTLGLGFASDEALWLVYPTRYSGSSRSWWPARFDGAQWEIGNPFDGTGWGFMGVHPDGPALRSSSSAARYVGGNWGSQTAGSPFLAPDGRLYSLWVDPANDLHVLVRSPDWLIEETDTVVLAANERPDNQLGFLAFSPSGQPVFEYLVDDSMDSMVLGFRRWDGSAWIPAADNLYIGPYVAAAAREFNVDSQGRIWLTPGQAPKSTWRWNGSAWENLGPVADLTPGEEGDGNPPYTQLVAKIDSQDRLVVAWAEANWALTSTTISVRRYGAAGWEDLGPPIQTHNLVYAPILAVAADGTPIIAWISAHVDRMLSGAIDSVKLKVARYAGE